MSGESTAFPASGAHDIHDWIERDHVAERYVQNRLESVELERFEEHYLTCETCIERLELAERFQSSLCGVVAEEANRALQVATLGWWARQLRLPAPWIVVGLLLLLVPSWHGWRLAKERDRLDQTLVSLRAPVAITAVARLDALRSAPGEIPAIQLLPPGEGEKLLLELEAEPGAIYDARLIDGDGRARWQGSGLISSTEARLRVVIGHGVLGRGAHTLELTPRSALGEPLLYEFLVLVLDTPTTPDTPMTRDNPRDSPASPGEETP